jgi:asparagine synthase (glutamine-hydrolysing)
VSRTITALTTDDPATRILAMSRVVGGDRWRSLYRSELSPASAEGLIAGAVNQRLPGRDLSILRQMLYLDAQTALVDKLLLYFDKMSMASSLEVRVPFMDHDVVSFCAALPDARRLSLRSRLRGKHILREVGKELVGAETLAKPKRGFFRSAVAAWLESNAEHVREVLLDERTLDRGLYRRDGVQHMLDPGAGKQFRRDEALLSLYLLEKWQRLFIDATLPSPARPRPLVVS